jgi:GNAT superfamily N-acetyltransferase
VIAFLPAAAADDAPLMTAVTDLVNAVYRESERGLWVDGATRTDRDEVAALTRAGELVAARRDGRLAGVLRLRRGDADSSEFGMLAADPAVRGTGVGRALVRHAEDTARERGDRFMRLELLVPRSFTLPSKDFLATWYARLGYTVERVGRIDELHPHLAPMLATDADVRYYVKRLG